MIFIKSEMKIMNLNLDTIYFERAISIDEKNFKIENNIYNYFFCFIGGPILKFILINFSDNYLFKLKEKR
jgi:hypothetical protein